MEAIERIRGFTLIEVLMSMALLVTAAAGIAQLTMVAAQASDAARARTATAMLAAQKMEQLQSLLWARDAAGGLLSDSSTDTSREPFASGGRGLLESDHAALERNVDGYVDYLDTAGRWIGSGTTPPPSAVYLRRWAVLPLDADPDHTRVLVVLATTVRQERARSGTGGPRPRLPDDTLLVSLKTRQAAGS
jgi:prepilin-type N-terminal cleavage/methylation domain-containing protein